MKPNHYRETPVLIPRAYIRCMQIFGLFPYSAQGTRSIPLLVWQLTLISILLFAFAGPVSHLYLPSFIRELRNPDQEVFAVIAFAFACLVFLQGVIVIALTAPRLGRLLSTTDDLFHILRPLLDSQQYRLRRMWKGVWIWNAVYVVCSYVSYCALQSRPEVIFDWSFWSQWVPFLPGGVTAPLYVAFPLLVGPIIVGAACECLVQGCLMTLLHMLNTGYAQVELHLQVPEEFAKVTDIHHTQSLYRRLLLNFRTVNDIFSPFILFGCARDLLAFIAVIGAALNSDKKVRYDSSNMVYLFGSLGFVNGVARLCMYLSHYSSVQNVQQQVQKALVIHEHDSELRRGLDRFAQHFDEYDGAVSACGCFLIMPVYITTLTGLLAAYSVFVYQTKDQQRSMDALEKRIVHLWNCSSSQLL